ncbi:MAG: CheR family methyltransferase [Candidatus Tectimicrobiota bacterium]
MDTHDHAPEPPSQLTAAAHAAATSAAAAAGLTVVALGASAGGIQALQRFFGALPPHPGMAFVVVVHLAPDRESALPQVLQRCTSMLVQQVTGALRMEPDHVYVIPPNQDIKVMDGHLLVTPFVEPRGRRAPIDVFFRTLATLHPDSIGIVLSGGGTDGTVGLKAIKEAGGVIMVQSPDDAEVETMPRSAIATGLVDFVLPAAELAQRLPTLRQTARSAPPSLAAEPPVSSSDSATGPSDQILQLLLARTGHDFSGYKPSTILRRLDRRMRIVQMESLSTYLDYLRDHPYEAQVLLKDLLISVTTFFRDSDAFEVLRTQAIPQLFAGKGSNDEVRVWVPGCATGEEAYSIAILLLEQVDTQRPRPHLQVFASDLDEEALTYAREGLYPDAIATDVSDGRLQQFFTQEGAYYRVKEDLRDIILFAPHNLLKDPPFSRLDLISCRNVLIYLQRPIQEKVAALLHYALNPEGYLFLGNAESLEGVSNLFDSVDKTARLYRRASLPATGRRHLPDLPLGMATAGRLPLPRVRAVSAPQVLSEAELHRQALEDHAPPSLLVDAEATIIHVSETANRYLQFPPGVPSPNLYRVALPALRLELRAALYRALERREATFSPLVPVEIQGQQRLVQIYVAPVPRGLALSLALVVFTEAAAPAPGSLPTEASHSSDVEGQLRHLEEELETTKAQLRATIESAETQQEELKAANEELQSINEEYRSTLEELETSKEELQSINEELKTVNQELQERLKEISQANNDFQNLIAATEVATLFVDRQLRIKLYTPPLLRLFNILPVDQGRPLAHVTHRLSDGHLLRDVQQVLDTLVPIEREVQRDDGPYYLMRLMPYRTSDDRIEGVVITFVDITLRKQSALALQQAHDDLEARVQGRTAELGAALQALQHETEERSQAEAESRRLQEETRRAEHFALLGRLAAGVSHEIRNPLGVVSLQVDLLEADVAQLPAAYQGELLTALAEIKTHLARLEDLVQDYLVLVRVGTEPDQTVHLGDLLHALVAHVATDLSAHGVTLVLQGLEQLGETILHPATFERALLNLVHNAIEAMPQGGTLTLRGRRTDSQLLLDITDTGVGIPAEHLAHIFEPLYTTKPSGTGFGLYLVRETLAAHRGSVTVTSTVGQGSTFTIALQRAIPPTPPSA